MTTMWNIKATYSSGGHVVTDKSGKALRFISESAAKDEAAMRNMNNNDSSVYYIVVKES